MFDLLETFQIKNGAVQHLFYHQKRVNEALLDLYQLDYAFSLKDFFEQQELPSEGIFRGRLLYEEEIKSFEILPYTEKIIKKFTLVDAEEFEYPYKWADRSFFSFHLQNNPEVDEVIFHKNGLITDCTIANLVFWKGEKAYTPKQPLLNGTTRTRLLTENKIQEIDIFVKQIHEFERISMINVFRELNYENSLSLTECIV